MRFSRPVAAAFLSAIASATPLLKAAEPLLKPDAGNHVCIIGNTLADRMQHDGWLETLLQAQFADKGLVIRNLGYSADEIGYDKRLRSKDFGTPDEWLFAKAGVPNMKKIGDPKAVNPNRFEKVATQPDILFMFFGYNESFAGEAGLAAFKKDLDRLLKHTAEQRYNGKAAPRVVLFAPIAYEDLKDSHLPDGKADNARLAIYTKAMAETAKANDAAFVDCFAISQKLYEANEKPLTINGIHLTEQGNKLLAEEIVKVLAGGELAKTEPARLQQLHAAVVDKCQVWFNRYRTTDGYSTYGERAFLQFKPENQSNYEVLQRELEVLDVMAQDRDRVITAIAQGQKPPTVDGNLPPFIVVKTNKPGEGGDEKHEYLSGEDAMKQMKLASGLKVQLFADEKRFPELINPVQMSFDTKGRLWVATWQSYPHWQPTTPMADKLLIFEDTDHDGTADKVSTFANDLHNPTGFEFWNGGIIVAQGPDIWFMKDTDGDDKVDLRERILHGFDTADTHHTANSFTFDPGGALYWQEGTFMHTQVETPWGPPVRSIDSAVYRFEPRTNKLSVYTAYKYANPHGHVFDRWGTDIITDGTSAIPYFGPAYSGRLDFPMKHPKAPVIYKQRTRPCPGSELLDSSHFPKFKDNFIVGNVIGFQGFLNYKLEDKGAGVIGKEVEPLLQSSDPNFRPSDLEVAPDGSLYFTDWQNTIIGHMQHNLRDPSRDKVHGRIYRITNTEAALLTPPKIAGEPVPALLDLLKSPERRVVYRAKIELSARRPEDVLPAVQKWAASLDKADKDYEHNLTEALWMYQWFDEVNVDLLKQVLRSKEPMARAAATRVLCYWLDRVPDAIDLVKTQAQDENPRVALEAVRACSFFGKENAEKASEAALEALTKHEDDTYVKYTLDETMKQLESLSK